MAGQLLAQPDRPLADRRVEGEGLLDGRIAGLLPRHDLDERDEVRRVERVPDQHPLGVLRGSRGRSPSGSMPDELDASTTSGRAAASSTANSACLTSSRSGPFSWTKSASATASAGSCGERQPLRRGRLDQPDPFQRRPVRGHVGAQPLLGAGRRIGGDDVEAAGEEVRRPARPDHAGARPRRTRSTAFTGLRGRVTKASSEVGSASTSRLATSSGGGPEQDLLHRQLQLLAGAVARHRRHGDDPVGDVPRRQLGAQRGGDPRGAARRRARSRRAAARRAAAPRCRLPGPPGAPRGCRRPRAAPRRRGRTRRCPAAPRPGSGWRPSGRR